MAWDERAIATYSAHYQPVLRNVMWASAHNRMLVDAM
jgi:hypothetical protein